MSCTFQPQWNTNIRIKTKTNKSISLFLMIATHKLLKLYSFLSFIDKKFHSLEMAGLHTTTLCI